ncbi:MAG: hypothetical protein PHP31_03250 [Lentimicrobiaceae bacterium]|nr:hypothetical protein [Lentimicrobiaceae bacterium]
MRIFRNILIVLLVLILSCIAVGFFLPKNVTVRCKTTIKAPTYLVYSKVANMQWWNEWVTWIKDSDSINNIIDIDGNILGLIDRRNSYQYYLKHSFQKDSLYFVFDFSDEGKSASTFYFIPEDSSTQVVWTFESKLGNNPISRWLALRTDKLVEPEMERSLQNLQNLFTKNEVCNYNSISKVWLYYDNIACETDSCLHNDFFENLKNKYTKTQTYYKQQIDTNPLVYITKIDSSLIHYNLIIPLQNETVYSKKLLLDSILVLKLPFFGEYKHSTNAYDVIINYAKLNNIAIDSTQFEEYPLSFYNSNNPYPDTTFIYIPIIQGSNR